MIRRREMTEQRKIMKTTKLILTVAVAFAAAFTSQLKAHEPLLSPRAQANQIRTVPGVTADSLDRANLFTHKSDAIAHPTTPGVTPTCSSAASSRVRRVRTKPSRNWPGRFRPARTAWPCARR